MKSTSHKYIILTILGIIGLGYYVYHTYSIHCDPIAGGTLPRIAHAGGGVHDMTYTDALDALTHNAPHYQLFELDFVFTRDQHLVCLHDWNNSAQRTFGRRFLLPPSLAEFNALVTHNTQYKNCTLQSLQQWLHNNPDKKIVTDIKENNIMGLAYIAQNFANSSQRFIPQIYQPDEYTAVKKLGFKDIIWTLYRYPGSSTEVVDEASRMDLFAITMNEKRARKGLACVLQNKLHLPSYVHTINNLEAFAQHRKQGITEIYTDWLTETP